MDNSKTVTKWVIERNDKFLRFNPTGVTEQDDPISANLYSTPGKAQRRLSQPELSDANLVAINISWEFAVPNEDEAELTVEEESDTLVDPS